MVRVSLTLAMLKLPSRESTFGVEIQVPTLAVIVPDMCSSLSSVLIGTNALDVLYEQYAYVAPQNYQSLPYGYKVALKTLEVRKKFQGGRSETAQQRFCCWSDKSP